METKTLSEICLIQSGGTPSRSNPEFWDGGDIPWVKISDFKGKYLSKTEECITEKGLKGSSAKLFPRGTILYTIFATLGEVCVLDIDAATNQAIVGLTVQDDCVEKDYLYYYLVSQKQTVNGIGRGAAQNNINMSILKNMTVPIPSKKKQREIVAQLESVSSLIASRREQLVRLEELVKSRFVEMFGDPMENPMGWEVVNLSAVVDGKVSNGFFAKRDAYCDEGNVRVLGVANVINRMYSKVDGLPRTNGTSSDIEKYSVKYGDMLFCRSSLVAEGIGKASIVPHETPDNVLFECHVIRLPLDLNKCVPEFMQAQSATDYVRHQIISQSKTATMTTIGQNGILKTNMILPPLELQQEFLRVVEHIEKLKYEVKEALDKLETMKNAMMQQYFG